MTDLRQRLADNFAQQPFMNTLGARLALVNDGEVHIALDFAPRLSQRLGHLHAGVATSIAHLACVYATLTRLPPEETAVVAELKINFLRPVIGETFVAVGRLVSLGRALAVCTADVRAFRAGRTDYKLAGLVQATLARPAGGRA